MSDTFDPYREWLGISASERPPNHYALLGLQLFEEDQEKISNASMLSMANVLQHDPGPHCQEARRIFDELESARACLSDPQRKAAYDARLQARLAGTAPKAKKSWGAFRVSTEDSSRLRLKADAAADSSVLSTSTAESAPGGSSIGRRSHESPKAKPPHRSSAAANDLQPQHAALVVGVLALMSAIVYFAVREPPEYDPVPSLLKQLHHQDDARRLAAVRSLKQLGPRASGAIPQLVQLLGSERNDDVRVAAAEALLHAGPGTISYARDLETIKQQETHPGVRQMIDQLTGK